ncbi:hypothetical protein ANDA3_1836 [plant metagenome]|uniref:Uncharacterized protein n=2 Tax=root TaxID=1 RepID=A0A1C3K151_9BURK|nr:hypothetical protein ODI_01554 [Orrella dioscoreae]SOE48976.1 hypothetical protein ODI_R1764 [Orrella dioscoreae]
MQAPVRAEKGSDACHAVFIHRGGPVLGRTAGPGREGWRVRLP